MFLIAGVLYLAALIWATWAAYRWAKRRGLSRPKCWLAAGGGFVIVYLPVFWDYIPTVVAHKYYCEKEAGFWVYKTLAQWKAENFGVLETLSAPRETGSPTRHERYDDGHGKKTTYLLNERFNWVVSRQDDSLLLPIIRTVQEVRDVKKNELLARYVDFATGNSVKHTVGPPGPLKFWLKNSNCNGGAINKSKLLSFADAVENRRIQGAER
jgi:hypothetical protein